MKKNLVVCTATELECALLRPHLPVLCTGIGAVNAASSLTRYLEHNTVDNPVDLVVSCGIGGAYPGSGLAIGDVAWASSECYGDLGADSPEGFLDLEALGFALLPGIFNRLPLPTEHGVPFVTVNTCTGTDAAAQAIAARTSGAVENMEGAAIAHVARIYGLRCLEVRGISNPVGNRNRSVWRVREAAEAAQRALLEVLLKGRAA